jgi:hypothetical protein
MSFKIGFAKTDITPRVGVEMCGFGPFLNRHSIGIRDRLWARAMAVGNGSKTIVIVSCDLIGFDRSTVSLIRSRVEAKTGLTPDSIMVHCTHTHSGPCTFTIFGWGDMDFPYMELLPGRIADACCRAVEGMVDATMSHALVPCEGIGLNREYDRDAPPLDEVLNEDWRPAKPELTDTVCHVLKATDLKGRLLGFCSYFGCHPVVCCQETRYIHGDFAGVATNMLERENPGSVGLFLQGAQGDVNSCVVHKPEPESLLALDVIACRYARCVRTGLNQAQLIRSEEFRTARREIAFSRIKLTRDELLNLLAEKEKVLNTANASDSDFEVRMASVYVLSIRRLLKEMDEGKDLCPSTELHGIRIGPISFLGSPCEIFQAIKNDVVSKAKSTIPLVMGLTNDCLGYAVDKTMAARAEYAAQIVPVMLGRLPFENIHDELSRGLIELDTQLNS